MEIELYQCEDGRWAYRVGNCVQEWHPDREGWVAMTKEEAQTCAEALCERLLA